MAREIIPRILNFNAEETYTLILQAALQVGKADVGTTLRQSHLDLGEEGFGLSFLLALNEAVSAIEGSWQGSVALRTFIVLAVRLLSSSPHTTIQQQSLLILRRAREVSLQWTRQVGMLLHETQDEEELKSLNIRILEMALTCHTTFNVDRRYISETLSSAKDIAAITECSITIHDRCPAVTKNLPKSIISLLERFTRLSHHLEQTLRERIVADREGIECTVHQVWSGYRLGGHWSALPEPSRRWLMTTTTTEGGYPSMSVHYNILDGSLLVNGKPITRLPKTYEMHPTYQQIFGQKVLDVVPSTMTDMEFETRNKVFDHQVHFAMHGEELIIRSQKPDQVYEVIPSHFLEGDFPHALVHDYTHWLRLDTACIEWRPLTQPWKTWENSWHMKRVDLGRFNLTRNGKALIDVRSYTAEMVSRILSPLEYASHIHIVFDYKTERLDINLPRFKLNFFLECHGSSLVSKQFRGMVVDRVQSFGALTGLVNKLVLYCAATSSRTVIIPYGETSFASDGNHVRVMIDTTAAPHVKYHSYFIDSQLGRLVDNGDLQSRLFRIYLHAATAHCLIDHLTGRTGTEEALDGLSSAATRSFVELDSGDIVLLEMLAELTPQRQYYPDHLRVMQQVGWRNLPFLSQHCGFRTRVKSILDQAKAFHVFQEHPMQLLVSETRGNQDLLERAAIRESVFQVHGFGAESHTVDHDVAYHSRDQLIDDDRVSRTFQTARLVNNWSQSLAICPQLLSDMESWGKPIQGVENKDELPIGFDLKWLDPPARCFPTTFCSLQRILSKSVEASDKYKIMMLLSTLSYSQYTKQELVETLLAFATVPELKNRQCPSYEIFQLSDGYLPREERLISITEKHVRQFHQCPESDLPSLPDENWYVADQRRRDLHSVAQENQVAAFVKDLILQWPAAISVPRNAIHSKYIAVDAAVNSAHPVLQSWRRNSQFKQHAETMQMFLNTLCVGNRSLPQLSFPLPVDDYVVTKVHVEFNDLTTNPAPPIFSVQRGDFGAWIAHGREICIDHDELKDMLARISARSPSGHGQRYAGDLLKSYEALCEVTSVQTNLPDDLLALLERNLAESQWQERKIHDKICKALQSGSWNASKKAQMLPRVSKVAILSHLSHSKIDALPFQWRSVIVKYGLSLTNLQRAERLLACARNTAEFLSELQNSGHKDWDPIDFPEWLLLEIENNILIRKEQAQIAHEMMSPSSGSNSVMQLNMGQGKSSVIVPIAAAALADKTKLIRVIVLKPLAMQMFNLMRHKLGGMLNRRICYMPISRSLKMDKSSALQIHSLFEECMRAGDIILVQPEHILSFELMGFESFLAEEPELELGTILVRTQDWLRAHSRDILDESDEILSVRFELIYTMGTQRTIEFSPNRWAIIQFVLRLLGESAQQVLDSFPNGLEVVPVRKGAFPKVRILQGKAGEALLQLLAQKICDHGVPSVSVWRLPETTRKALRAFLMDATWTPAAREALEHFADGSESLKQALLLLKGLFSVGVLRFCFEQKRWRVQYGLDPSRTMLAVPYHAKDSPAPRAEFSHPDATIVLTCLSYYYGGLSDEQIRTSFEVLLQSDHAAQEYAFWVQDAPELPVTFRHLTGVNLSNTGQCHREIFPPLRFAIGIINFYMSSVVFPAEMKEFPDKLSSSGWDIAREKCHPTTGFSGTNDSRYILPLSITQCDLPQQLYTNAAVLDCLLRPENSVIDVCEASGTGFLDAEVLIKAASSVSPPARVILDVGAQVLELQNEEMAHTWLSKVPKSEAQAVIFFDHRNEICVLGRDGSKEPLQVSPFLKQMDQCLVYLDEAHTRGTDLKLPTNYRAIVTLGPGLTKDRLVQACMRMRKLGNGQSVVFCSSLEVQRKILEHSGTIHSKVEVTDVLQWCITNTCTYAGKSIPLWATQGLRHQRRLEACSRPFVHEDGGVSDHLFKYLLEPEAQTLQERYGGGGSQHAERLLLRSTPEKSLLGHEQHLAEIRAKCQEFEVSSFSSATLHEEQERELSPENEREEEVEHPTAAKPRKHNLHPDVQSLVTNGMLIKSSDAFQPAFETLQDTIAHSFYEPTWPKHLLVTVDFAQTIQAKSNVDSYLRPVHWIIRCSDVGKTNLVVLSPYEVQNLLPVIRKHKRVSLHVYSPRLNVDVRSVEDLTFCAIPPVPKSFQAPPIIRQLNMFAGQLYIRDFAEYLAICGFLGLSSQAPEDGIVVGSDGFVDLSSRKASSAGMFRESPFTKSPMEFLRSIMVIRRKGQSFAMSHFGKILNGELISEGKFEG